MKRRINISYQWYDLYIGFYYNRFKKLLYIVILGVVLQIRIKDKYTRQDTLNYREHRINEIVEDLADKFGIYEGQYNRDEECRERNWHPKDCACRNCFSIEMTNKIREYSLKNMT
jgi:hypothetical protein